MENRKYPTDLSDDEWRCIRPHLPGPTGDKDAPGSTACGRSPRRRLLHSKERLSLAATLPKDFLPWKTVYDWFRRWRIDGTWERLNTELRELLRWHLGRDPNPSAGVVDSQSVKTTGVGGNERGFDPAKRVEPRGWKVESAIY